MHLPPSLRRGLLVLLILLAATAARAITIGPGPVIGTDKRGTVWYQEFQDWAASDVRALDPNGDEYILNDGYDSGRDLIAFYSHDGGSVASGGDGNYYFRADVFEMSSDAAQGLNIYVAIDCAAGGTSYMPDNMNTNTDHPWNLCVKVYQNAPSVIVNSSFTDVTSGNWVGSYANSSLDSVEFGITRQALINAGWDGSSVIYFQVFSSKSNTTLGGGSNIIDAIGSLNRNVNNTGYGLLSGAIASNSTTNRAKYAVIAHANQSVGTRTNTGQNIYEPRSDLNLYPGFVRLLDTHQMLNAPLNMHMSGCLISSLLWARENPSDSLYPNQDGPTFINRIKSFVNSGLGAIVGGVYAENIMPYFEGPVNQASIAAYNDLAYTVFGLSPSDMKVMHIPERVMQLNTSWSHANPSGPLKGMPINDITAGGYVATYMDEITHLHWWFYPAEQYNSWWTYDACGVSKWAGFMGTNDETYQHKLHKINGVLCFMINDREDNAKFGNANGGMALDTRYTLLNKALSSDYAQITVVFDDWEAYAGNSFGAPEPNNNADQWHNTIRWAANHQWIQIVRLEDVVGWAQADSNWVIDDGTTNNHTTQTYEYLKRNTEQSYDNWYYGSNQEQSFFNRVPSTNPDGSTPSGVEEYGDLNTPGTLLCDSWGKVTNMPSGALQTLAQWTYAAMIYETAWHNVDSNATLYQSRNYQVTFDRIDACAYSISDTTYQNISGWALQLHGHARSVGILADAAQWVQDIKSGAQGPTTVVLSKDVDNGNTPEYILKNNHVYLCFKRWGARLVAAFLYNPATQDATEVIGSPVSFPDEEHDGEDIDNNRCSGLKDRYITNGSNNYQYINSDYAATAPISGSNYWQFTSADGQITKRVILPTGRDVLRADYTVSPSIGTIYIRTGLGPNQLDLLHYGDAHLSVQSDSTYYGLANSQGGAAYVVTGSNTAFVTGQIANAGYQNRQLPLVEQVEVYNTNSQTNFTFFLAFSQATASDIDNDGLSNTLELSLLGSSYANWGTPNIDGSGMPAGYEYQYFGTPTGVDPNADPDHDGYTNLQEYIAGTNPNDPASRLQITSIVRSSTSATITWSSVPGRSYVLEAAPTPSGAYAAVSGTLTATSASTSATDPAPPAITRFYRVRVFAPTVYY